MPAPEPFESWLEASIRRLEHYHSWAAEGPDRGGYLRGGGASGQSGRTPRSSTSPAHTIRPRLRPSSGSSSSAHRPREPFPRQRRRLLTPLSPTAPSVQLHARALDAVRPLGTAENAGASDCHAAVGLQGEARQPAAQDDLTRLASISRRSPPSRITLAAGVVAGRSGAARSSAGRSRAADDQRPPWVAALEQQRHLDAHVGRRQRRRSACRHRLLARVAGEHHQRLAPFPNPSRTPITTPSSRRPTPLRMRASSFSVLQETLTPLRDVSISFLVDPAQCVDQDVLSLDPDVAVLPHHACSASDLDRNLVASGYR